MERGRAVCNFAAKCWVCLEVGDAGRYLSAQVPANMKAIANCTACGTSTKAESMYTHVSRYPGTNVRSPGWQKAMTTGAGALRA